MAIETVPEIVEVLAFTRLCQCFLTGALIPFSALAGDIGSTIDPLVIKDKSLFLFQYHSEPEAALVPFFGAFVERTDPYGELVDTRDTSYSSADDKNWRAGFRYKLSKALSLSFDAKRRDFAHSVKLKSDSPTDLDVNVKPWAIRVGISYKW